jgi:hypothetical protein
MKNGFAEKNRSLAPQRNKSQHNKTGTGKTSDKYPVILDGGRTIIFVSDKKKEKEVRRWYESHQHKMPAGKIRS